MSERQAAVLWIVTLAAKLNGRDPQAWLNDTFGRIANHPVNRIDEFLPWTWAAAHAHSASTQKAA